MPQDNPSAPAETVGTTAPTFEQSVDDISALLADPVTDPAPETKDETAAAAEPVDDPLGLEADAEDVATDDAADNPDESEEPEIVGGRFAPDTAKVTLDDGTVTTIAELKRGTLFQRDYTKKTQELSKERETFAAERDKVSQYAQELDQSREYVAWYAEQFLPKQPGPAPDPNLDPHGFQVWQYEVNQWQAHVQAYQQFKASQETEGQRKAGETQKQMQERMQRESMALREAIPVLKDPVKGKQVWDAIVDGAAKSYGLTQEDINSITDHRIILALREGLAYRRIKASAPQVQAEVRRPVVRDGRRAPPNAAANRDRQARSERLRSTGSIDDAAAILSSLL